MAVSIALVARVPLDYHGSAVAAGEVFAARLLDALRLTHRGVAAFADAGVTIGSTPHRRFCPDSKREYQRRDLRAKP